MVSKSISIGTNKTRSRQPAQVENHIQKPSPKVSYTVRNSIVQTPEPMTESQMISIHSLKMQILQSAQVDNLAQKT
jgi:hypothetical protein